MPKSIPITALGMDEIFSASGIRSKLNIAVINPDAKDNIKLKNLFDGFLNFIPIIPPMVVPNVQRTILLMLLLIIHSIKSLPVFNLYSRS